MTRECKQQFTLRISQANSTELIVILYEMLLCYLEESKGALNADNEAEFKEAIRKSRGCLNELMGSLNMEYEICRPRLLLRSIFLCGRRK
jgi:flagellar protein FliS